MAAFDCILPSASIFNPITYRYSWFELLIAAVIGAVVCLLVTAHLIGDAEEYQRQIESKRLALEEREDEES